MSTYKPFDPFEPQPVENAGPGPSGFVGNVAGAGQPATASPMGDGVAVPIGTVQKKKDKKDNWWHGFVKPLALLLLVMFCGRSVILDWNDVPTGSMLPSILLGDRVLVNKLAYGLRFPFTYWWLARWDTPKRGDIVIVMEMHKHPETGEEVETRIVKRVIGLPGDKIQINNNRLTINGEDATYEEDPSLKLADALTEEQKKDIVVGTERLGEMKHPYMLLPKKVDRIRDDARFSRQGLTAKESGRLMKLTEYPVTEVPAGHYFLMGDNRNDSEDSRFFGPVPEKRVLGRAFRIAFSLDSQKSYMPRFGRIGRKLP